MQTKNLTLISVIVSHDNLFKITLYDDEYYPIIIDLRCTTIEIINRYIEYACKYRIENKDVLLIIDGFSESTSSIFNGALSTLCNLPDENLCIKVIVTKRDNYELKFFDSYHTFHISAFNDEDIKNYLTMRRVQDIPRFMQSISASDYGYVIGIPFVLNAVIDIYSKDRSIPKFNNLMQQIISLRFMEADNSLSNKYQIMPVEHEVIISLEELGFVMQAVCEHPLANIYYSQLFDEKIQFDGRKTECIKKFFVNIGKLDEVLYAIINEKNSLNFYSSFESIISSELIDKLIQYYFDGVFSESQFSWYINRYSVSENDKDRLKDAYKTKHGKEIQLHEKSEWAINHDAGEREFFNSLFEKNLFECKVRNLIALFEHDIPISQFFEKWFSMIPEDKQDLQMIGGLIHRSVGNIDLLFSEFIETKDTFTMELNEPQRTFLQKKFNEILEHTNYEAISYESPESQNTRFVISLISKFGFNCNDEKLLEMIMLPWYVFASSSVSKSSDVISFIQKHISDETKLQNRIVFNLEHKELSIYAQANHISYCMNAINLFESTDSHAEYLKYIAIEYLLRITSEEYIDKLISNKTEDTILKYLSSRLLTYNNNLVAEMIARNEKSSDYFLFIGELIILNIKYGVKKYSDFIREHLTIPELFNQEYSNLDITLQLRKLKNVSLIGEVTDLLLTAYSKDFLDRDDVWGLKVSLDNVFMIMCKENPEQVKQYMEKLLNADQNNDEFIFKCNYFLSLCEETLISLSVNDGCWTFQDAIKYVRNRRLDA